MAALFYDDIIAFKEMMYQQRSAETERISLFISNSSVWKNAIAVLW